MASRQMNMDKGEKQIYGAGDGNRTNPNEPNKGVTTRSTVQLESNGVKSKRASFSVDTGQIPYQDSTCPVTALIRT